MKSGRGMRGSDAWGRLRSCLLSRRFPVGVFERYEVVNKEKHTLSLNQISAFKLLGALHGRNPPQEYD